jgi:GNAT superfamily N-acetyltransferase
MVEVILVRSQAEIEDVKTLIYEFIDWLGARYPELEDTIRSYFKQQGFNEEMADLLKVYGPPCGECLLARIDDKPAGIVMFKPHGTLECEMNRMFVRSSARRQGVAQALTNRMFTRAKDLGYQRMILSALDKHHEAIPLYRKLGFTDDDRPSELHDNAHEVRMVRDL